MALSKKIQQRKIQAPAIQYSSVTLTKRTFGDGETFESLLDKRIVRGYLLVWGSRNMHGEKFLRGCCAKSIADRGPNSNASYKITFLNQHRQYEPVSVFMSLIEDDYGLLVECKPADDVPWADNLLKQIRSGTINQLSAGFNPVWDKAQWDDSDDSIVYAEIDLWEGSAVTIGSEQESHFVRSAETEQELTEDIEFLLNKLPRKQQYEARQLFARQKALLEMPKPPDQLNRALNTEEPPVDGIDFDFLINNL